MMKKVLIKGGFITLMAALALLAGCLSYSVESVEVTIDGNATSIDAGKTIQFNFRVTATGKDTSQAQRVKWSVSSTNDGTGPVTPGTSVSPSGTLAVSPDEIYPILYVRAAHDSFAYSGKYDFKQIQVKGPKVGSVVLSVTGNAASVVAGGTAKLSAFVAGQAPNQGLTYSVGSAANGTGAVAAGTAIAGDGTLTVSANETASSLYVKAASNSDATKFDIKEIKIVTVTSVTVSAEGGTARVLRGGKLKFNAVVAGNNSPGQNVTWKVSSNAAGTGTVTDGTTVASDGTLSVAAAEAAATLYVTATSSVNTTKSGSVTVTIPTVTSVSVSPVNPQIKRGEGATFTARVQGTGNPSQDVTWKLDGIGGSTTVTTITSNGMVIANAAETLSQLLITATSVDDPAKSGTTMITIPAIPAAVVPVTPPPQVQAPAPQVQAPAATPAPQMNWTAVTNSTFGTSIINKITWGNGKFVAVGADGKMATSPDGATWTAVSNSIFTSYIRGIAWGNGKFVAVGDNGKMATSSDGTTWTAVTNSTFGTSGIGSIAWGNNKFVAVGADGKMAYSSDGTTWTAVTNSTFGTSGIGSIAYANNKFLVGAGGKMATSPDGIIWTAVSNSTFGMHDIIAAFAWGNGKFVAVGWGGKMATSPDGATWTAVSNSTLSDIYGIVYANNKFVAVSYSGKIATSPDGTTWTAVSDSTFGRYDSINAIAYANNKFVVVGSGGKIAYSTGY